MLYFASFVRTSTRVTLFDQPFISVTHLRLIKHSHLKLPPLLFKTPPSAKHTIHPNSTPQLHSTPIPTAVKPSLRAKMGFNKCLVRY